MSVDTQEMNVTAALAVPRTSASMAGTATPGLQRAVDQVLSQIDWSRRDIVLWMPGTSESHVPDPMRRAVVSAFDGVVPVAVPYEASWSLTQSVADGAEKLAAVLREIESRGGRHRVFLAGQSQGAWAISEVMSRPGTSDSVERAVLFGHPSFAAHHDHAFRHGDRILEINHSADSVSTPLSGDAQAGLRAFEGIAEGKVRGNVRPLLSLAVKNPGYLGKVLLGQRYRLPLVGERYPDPHVYTSDMAAGAAYLRTGTAPAAKPTAGR